MSTASTNPKPTNGRGRDNQSGVLSNGKTIFELQATGRKLQALS